MGNRVSALESRHEALGASLADWNDMAVAWTYATSTDEEHAAVRQAAGVIDYSALRKVRVTGPDAFATVDYLLPRNMDVIYPGKSGYSTVLNEEGGVVDDLIVYRLAEDHFLLAYGTGDTWAQLQKAAKGRDVSIELDEKLHCVSLQGPKSATFLDAHTPIDLQALKFFHQEETTLFGKPAIISRTGYTGERGYEIYADADVIGDIWDNIVEKGKSEGIIPFSFVALNNCRIEAGLLFHPFDVSENESVWEAGLGWSVAKDKGDYIGKAATEARKGKETKLFSGIVADADEAVGEPIAGGEKVYVNGEEVGYLTASMYSKTLNKSIAMGYLKPDVAQIGTQVEIRGKVTCNGTVSELPFYDPEKLKVRGLA